MKKNANRVIDFRYAPDINQTCIGFADDYYKTIVREDGSLNYLWEGDRNQFVDGTIPAWDGGMSKVPAGWKPGRLDPYAADKPLFSVDASNLDKYQDKIPPGQAALIKTYKGYKLDVYPTHRSAALPDTVLENSRKNAVTAQSLEGGRHHGVDAGCQRGEYGGELGR